MATEPSPAACPSRSELRCVPATWQFASHAPLLILTKVKTIIPHRLVFVHIASYTLHP